MRPACTSGLAQAGQEVVGAVWLVDEGGLSAELAHDVWAGRRRPRGNLGGAVAGGAWRPVVGADAAVTAHYPHRDAAGVTAAGYRASAGRAATPSGAGAGFSVGQLWLYRAAVALLAILRFRAGAHRQQAGGQQRLLYRDGYLAPERARRGAAARGAQASGARLAPLRQRIELALAIPGDDGDTPLGEEDWRELAGFAFAHRPLEASPGHCSVCCWPAICRCPRCAAICNGGNPRRPARSWRASAGRKPCCATGGTKRRRRWNS